MSRGSHVLSVLASGVFAPKTDEYGHHIEKGSHNAC